jgi:hypothetical protein
MMENKVRKYQILIASGLLLVYLISGFGVTISNDALTNIEQISKMDLWHRSSHFGFHFLGILSFSLFKLIGINDAITTTQFMLSLVSVAGVIALFRIVLLWRKDLNLALIVAIIYGLNSNVWRFSVQNEYHVLVPAISLVAISLWLHGKQLLGSMFLGLAILTSPFAIFSLPLVLIQGKKLNSRVILKTIAGLVLVVGLVGLFTYEETLKGEWSYDFVLQYYINTLKLTNPIRVLSIWFYGYLRAFHVFIFLLIIFLIKYRKSEKRLLIICLMGLIFHLPLALPETRYGAYQMTFYPLLAIICGLVLQKLNQLNRAYFIILAGLFILLSSFIVLEERGYQRSLRDSYVKMQNDSSIADSSIVFMYKATRPLSIKYAPRLEGVSVYSGYQENLLNSLINHELPNYGKLIRSDKQVYLIESGVSLPDDYLKMLFSKFTKNQGAKLKDVGIKKVKEICPSASFEELQGYSTTIYRVNCD